MSRNDGHNILSTEVVFFKGTPVENALEMSALTPLTIKHGMVNDELMEWYFAYYQTYGPQNAFEECLIADSFMWASLYIHVSKHGPTENSLKDFVERRLAKRHTRCNTLIVPVCHAEHWSLMILERGKYYHMNPKPDYEFHSNYLQMLISFAKSWECGWFVLKYFDMYTQQRFVATEMQEFERVSNTLCTTFM